MRHLLPPVATMRSRLLSYGKKRDAGTRKAAHLTRPDCRQCGKPLSPGYGYAGRGLFCSMRCGNLYAHDLLLQSNDPARDVRIGAYLRAHWGSIHTGLLAAVDWWTNEDSSLCREPHPDCEPDCEGCRERQEAEDWQDQADSLAAMINTRNGDRLT